MGTLLFATDLGPHTSELLQYFEQMFQDSTSELVVVHAIEPLGSAASALAGAILPEDLRRQLDGQGMLALAKSVQRELARTLASASEQGCRSFERVREIRVVPGRPAEVILAEAERYRVDAIVIGSHGGSATPTALGSVSARVLQTARVPVLLVPLARVAHPEVTSDISRLPTARH